MQDQENKQLKKELVEVKSASLSGKPLGTFLSSPPLILNPLVSAQDTVSLLERVRALEGENAALKAASATATPMDAQIQINDLKIKLAEQTQLVTRYRNERNQLVKVMQKHAPGATAAAPAPLAGKK